MITLLLSAFLTALPAHGDPSLNTLNSELTMAYDKARAGHAKADLDFLAQSQHDWLKTELPRATDKAKAYQARLATLENWWEDKACKGIIEAPGDYNPAILSGEHKSVTIGGKSLDIDLAEQGTAHNSGLALPYSMSTVGPWDQGIVGSNEKIITSGGKYYDAGVTSEYQGGVRRDHVQSVTVLSARGYQVPVCQSFEQKSQPVGDKLSLNHDESLCTSFLKNEGEELKFPAPEPAAVEASLSAPPETLADSTGPDDFAYQGATIRADLLGTKSEQAIARIVKESGSGSGCQKQGLAVAQTDNLRKLQDFKGTDGFLANSLNGLSREISCQHGSLHVRRIKNHDYVESLPRQGIRRLYSMKDGRAEMVCEVSTPSVRSFKIFIGHGGTVTIAEP